MSPWYSEWMSKHLTVFAMSSEANVKTLASWEPLFMAAGYTAAELNEATDWLAMNDPPKWPGDHLDAIRRRIQFVRVALCKATPHEEELRWGTCTKCLNAGWVVVPHLSRVRDGNWASYQTMAVICSCPLGRIRQQNNERQQMSLEQYTLKNPRWQTQLWQRAKEKREACKLEPDNEKLLERLAKTFRLPYEGSFHEDQQANQETRDEWAVES